MYNETQFYPDIYGLVVIVSVIYSYSGPSLTISSFTINCSAE